MSPPLPYSDRLDGSIFWTIYIGWFVLETLRSRRLRSQAGDRRQDRYSGLAVVLAMFAGVAASFTAAFNIDAATIGARQAAFDVGVVLMLGGVVLRTWAIRALGRSFTFDVATRSNQVVYDAGPYRYIRHPSYAGALVTLAGIGFALGNWVSVALAVLVPALGYAYRIHVEETALRRDLGAPYEAYRRRTKRLVPFVY